MRERGRVRRGAAQRVWPLALGLLGWMAAPAATGCAAHSAQTTTARPVVAAEVAPVSRPEHGRVGRARDDCDAGPPRGDACEPRSLRAIAFGALTLSGDMRALRAGRPVAFLLRGPEPLRLMPQIARVHPEAQRTVDGVLIHAGRLGEDVEPRHRLPSYVVDSDAAIVGELTSSLGQAPTPSDVRSLVAAHLHTGAHGEFQRASLAAELRTGDCTEHAVVAAAIARRIGLPARVVLGYALVSDGRHGMAVGHAWAEIHDGVRWQRVDSTPLAKDAAGYLVLGELEDEGPDYQRSLAGLWAMLNASGIEVVPRAVRLVD